MTNQTGENILLTAGGTGGHLYGAQSLAFELSLNDYNTFLLTDKRVGTLVEGFKPENVKEIYSATFTNTSFYKWPLVIIKLFLGFIYSLILIKKFNPKIVIGFGGYPTIPVIFAAKMFRLKIIIHEQNMILGRANKLLLNFSDILTTGFKNTIGIPTNIKKQICFSGNPIRQDILKYKSTYKVFKDNEKFRLVIFGGSQGASFFSKTIPLSLSKLSDEKKTSLEVFHQVRSEEFEDVSNFYKSENIKANVSKFFDNLPELLNSSHLIIARSGASSVSEISAIGRPAILVPLTHSIDNDQKLNALNLEKTGLILSIDEEKSDSDWFYKKIDEFMNFPNILKEMSNMGKSNTFNNGSKNILKIIKKI